MPLSTTELQSLKTDITVTRASTSFQGKTLLEWWNDGADGNLATFYNQTASPTVLLWNPRTPTQALVDSLVGTEYEARTQAQRDLLDVITRSATIDATQAQVRTNFSTAVGAGSTTLTNWTARARKNATYFEALYVTSTAGGASVTAQYGAVCRADDVSQARSV